MHIVKLLGVISCIICITGNTLPAQDNKPLAWMSLQQSETALVREKRPVLIDLYTNWCSWCKVMDKKTYTDRNVISYLQEKFYVVKLNAETKDSIAWSGKTFGYNKAYRANDIALYLTQGVLSFPTTVIIPTNGAPPQAIPGYLTPKEIEVLLKYFGENSFGKIPFQEYSKDFKTSW